MNGTRNGWLATLLAVRAVWWLLLGCCVVLLGCGSTTFYPVLYGNSGTTDSCTSPIKLHLRDVTAAGAIDDEAIQLQRPDNSLRREKAKEWRDTPTELFRQGVRSACVSDRWKNRITLVDNPAQADLRVTVHLDGFYVKADECDDPTGATISAIVEFSPAVGKPKRTEGKGDASDRSQNPYSAAMSRALSKVVDSMLIDACGLKSDIPIPTPQSPNVVTIPAWDSVLQRDLGVVISVNTTDSGIISIRDRYGAAVHEWSISGWRFDGKSATFNVTHPWSITGATMELREEAAKKKAKKKAAKKK